MRNKNSNKKQQEEYIERLFHTQAKKIPNNGIFNKLRIDIATFIFISNN